MIEPPDPWPQPEPRAKPEDDLDYVRAALEVDPEFAFITIPALSTPKVGLYVIENIDGQDMLKYYGLLRDEAVRWLLDPTKNIIGLG